MKSHVGVLLLLALVVAPRSQEAVDLDAMTSVAPVPRRSGDGIRLGDIRFNLYFDAGLAWSKEIAAGSKSDLRFVQQHTSLLARVATSDGIEAYADILNPGEVFEGTIPLAFFAPSLSDVPVIGKSAIKGGRMIVPFGDFEEHPIYGGAVGNSSLLRDVVWSDYGMGLIVPWGKAKTELYVVNGIRAYDSIAEFGGSWSEPNELKGIGCRLRLDLFPGSFVTGSAYHDALALGDSLVDTPQDRATLLGLDAGMRTGPISWRTGAAKGWIAARNISDYQKWGWYAEGKWSFDETWALRLRGGQVDPDSREKNDLDQTNVNLAGIWTRGPVDTRLTIYRNFASRDPNDTERDVNKYRVLLETYLSL